MADKRESNKYHEEAFKVRNIICERELKHLRHIEYEDMKVLVGIFHEVHQPSKKSIGEIKIDIDCSEALKGMKAITREAKNATAALKELDEVRRETKLLVIELDTEEAIPKIFYDGKRIEHLVDVELNWRTKTDKPGYTRLKVNHYKENGMGYPELNRIGISK